MELDHIQIPKKSSDVASRTSADSLISHDDNVFGDQHQLEEDQLSPKSTTSTFPLTQKSPQVQPVSHPRAGARSRARTLFSLHRNDDSLFTGITTNKKVEIMYFQDTKPKQFQRSHWEKLQENIWYNDNAWIKVFLLVSLSFAVIILALECFLFGVYLSNISSIDDIKDDDPSNSSDINWVTTKRNAVATYLALYIYAEVYQVFFTLITLYTRNIYHLLSSVGFLAAMSVYSGVQLYELRKTLINELEHQRWESICQSIAIAVLVLNCLLFSLQAYNGYKLKDIFKQRTGEKVGINASLIRANVYFNLHRDAIMLSFFFFPAFTLQFIVIALDKGSAEFIITVIVLGFSFFLLIFADYCATREIIYALGTVLVIYLAALAYLGYKLHRLFTRYADIAGKRSLIAFDIFTIVLTLWLFLLTIMVIKNFGKGLKEVYKNNYHWYSSSDNQNNPTINNTNNHEKVPIAVPNNRDSTADLFTAQDLSAPRQELDF